MASSPLFDTRFHRQKPGKTRMLAGGFIMATIFLTFIKLFYGPHLPSPNLKANQEKPICRQEDGADICEAIGDIRVHGKSSTIYVVSTQGKGKGTVETWNVRPYARNSFHILRFIRSITIKKSPSLLPEIPKCSRNFSVPAIVFSTAVEYESYFHDMTDILIPLYSASMEFNGEVQFVLNGLRPSWAIKFKKILRKLSKFELVEMDSTSDQVLCFPRITIGIKDNKSPSISTSNSPPYSRKDFVMFLKHVYSLKRHQLMTIINTNNNNNNERVMERPRLLIISREKTRRFVNAEEIAHTAEQIGFQVVVNETGNNLTEVAQFVNSFDALMGVHGAGLTNLVFLPENALVIQIVPWGLDPFLAKTLFKNPAEDMNLRYLEYRIRPDESSLWHQYSPDHQVFKDVQAVYRKGKDYFWPTYFEQAIKLDVETFYVTLSEAYQLLHSQTRTRMKLSSAK